MNRVTQFPDYVNINAVDLLKDPRVPTLKVMDYFFFKIKTICGKCHDYKTFKLIRNTAKGDCFTIKCKCGIDIIYPESKDRGNCRLWVNIPKEEFIARRDNNGSGKIGKE